MSEKLKTCPFCGGDAALNDREDANFPGARKWHFVECQSCDIEGLAYLSPKMATDQWNRRATPSREEILNEAARVAGQAIVPEECSASEAHGRLAQAAASRDAVLRLIRGEE